MTDWKADVTNAMADFEAVMKLAGLFLRPDDWQLEFRESPHQPPPRFPSGRMAIYAFWGDGGWLKVGMAGAKSQARYTSQHYQVGRAPSSLAASLVADVRLARRTEFDPADPGRWIMASCHRVNILIDAGHGRPVLALLEAFLHVRLRPRYENKAADVFGAGLPAGSVIVPQEVPR